jgi:hypothetical protein
MLCCSTSSTWLSLVQAHSFSSVGHSAKHVAPTLTLLALLLPLLLLTLPLLATPTAATVPLLLLLLLLLLPLSVLLLLLQRHFCDSSNMLATVAADVLLSAKLPLLAVEPELLLTTAIAPLLLLLLLRSVYSS